MNEILHAGEKELTLDLDHWLGIEESRLKQGAMIEFRRQKF